ncbi:hypothetical protein M404DRAFT_149135 [Pisolithus tinctorius Marx 270]|uniref:Uncharacterized protein n=1 Tax=Pisolithus tinctorius Marx 270 TaxID=870435 RepID=A0A0C3P2Z4_PISTI|nr:hypothetical protein M404DRAFT_149135 [Pisolithus tinctorius Marx 270]
MFTRKTELFTPKWVKLIIKGVKIGDDLTTKERKEVINLITEFADIFACSLSEVLPIPGAKVNLNVPDDMMFSTIVCQCPMNPPQRQFMNKWVNQMLEAGLIKCADILQIKHVAPTVLTQEAHDNAESMTINNIQ